MASGIKEIAADAQVSIATVSRVLNGNRRVNEDLRQRVLASVQKHGYQPNLLARGLRTHRSYIIGVVIPSISNPFFTEAVRAVESVADEAGCTVTICSSDYDVAKEQRQLDVLRSRMVDGIILAVNDRHTDYLRNSELSRTPIVLMDRQLGDEAPFDCVLVDTKRGALMAVDHLVARGYRRLGFIGGPQNISTAVLKLEGFLDGMRQHALPVDHDLVVVGDHTEPSGLQLGRYLLDLPQPPEAVVVVNNQMTLGFLRAVGERGLRMPKEIALIAFDDADWASLIVPPLTVIGQPVQEMGRIAAQMLLERINGNACPIRRKLLPAKLVVRGSC